MTEFLTFYYPWLRALHIISVISWMAGMLYLPRLFVYHAESNPGSEKSETFKIMERRLLRLIINPAMITTFIFGALMLTANPSLLSQPWMHMKLTAVIFLSGLHGFFAKTVKVFARDANTRTARFYRIINEVPALLMAVIVIMVVVQPLS
jgi:putative membrane protein